MHHGHDQVGRRRTVPPDCRHRESGDCNAPMDNVVALGANGKMEELLNLPSNRYIQYSTEPKAL